MSEDEVTEYDPGSKPSSDMMPLEQSIDIVATVEEGLDQPLTPTDDDFNDKMVANFNTPSTV